MPRYVARRERARDDFEEPFRPGLSVDGPAEVDTRLLDAKGNRIYRVQPPIGFGRNSEW